MKNLKDFVKESMLDNHPKAYKSISDFRKYMSEEEIRKSFEFCELNNTNSRHVFDKKFFNGAIFDKIADALGNDWNSYMEAIKFVNGELYFEFYIQGDSTDDTVDISYDDFTKPSGDVEIESYIAKETAVYSKEDRLKILNNLFEILQAACDGQKIFK